MAAPGTVIIPAIDQTHDPATASWVKGAETHPDFPLQNLPLGTFRAAGGPPVIGSAIGDWIVDLGALARNGHLLPELAETLSQPTLNALFARPAETRRALRKALHALLATPGHRDKVVPHLHRAAECRMLLPVRIGDYTDFYAGIHHATNIGRLVRPDNPLLPNYKHVPIAYHGRASSIRPSGTDVVRPCGQRKSPDADAPDFGPCRQLDYEVELGVWLAGGNTLGDAVPIAQSRERIAGLCLLNDWSARDLQAWEYQPLGPFLAKSFLTSISPWVITAEALAPFRVAQPARPSGDPQPLPYLVDSQDQGDGAFAIRIDTDLDTAKMLEQSLAPYRLSSVQTTELYWTPAQMVTHHASNGCDLQPGDLLGTGTVSGRDAGTLGSLMEITRHGSEPILLPTGEQRRFLEDGDRLTLTARAQADGFRSIGFGSCTGIVTSAREITIEDIT